MRRFLVISAVLLSALSSCKEKDDFVDPNFKDSYFHFASASSLVDTFSVVFDYYNADDVVISKYWFQKSWPLSGYAELTAGGVPDEFGNGKLYVHGIKYQNFPLENDSIMKRRDIILEPEVFSSAFLADSAGQMIIVKFKDEITTPEAGKTNIRFVNLEESVNSATLSAAAAGLNLPGVALWSKSGISQVTPGVYTFQATDDGTGAVISSSSVTIYEGGTYTFYLGGAGSGSIGYYRH